MAKDQKLPDLIRALDEGDGIRGMWPDRSFAMSVLLAQRGIRR